jgi:hypothetical protein
MSNGSVGISFEDTQALLQQLERFRETIGGDWGSVANQWQNLQSSWQDRQYDRFEPVFEELSRTYSELERQQEEYIEFLQNRLRSSEDAAQALSL